MKLSVKKYFAVLGACCWMLLSVQLVAVNGKVLRRVPRGVWGGEHIQLTVKPAGADIEYDCGGGTINGPLLLDRRGGFNNRGTHTRGHGGPIRLGEQPNNSAALYTGKVTGRVMTLTVKLAGTDEHVETYTLRQGVVPRLHRCL